MSASTEQLILDDRALRRVTDWPDRMGDRGWRPYEPQLCPEEGVLTVEVPSEES